MAAQNRRLARSMISTSGKAGSGEPAEDGAEVGHQEGRRDPLTGDVAEQNEGLFAVADHVAEVAADRPVRLVVVVALPSGGLEIRLRQATASGWSTPG